MNYKLLKMMLGLTLVLFYGCSNNANTDINQADNELDNPTKSTTVEASDNESNEINEVNEEDEEKTEEVEEKLITESELESLIEEQPLKVVGTEYVVQSQEHKTLYPDMLQAVIENNSGEDIRDAKIAFVAWDSNGLPLKLEASFDLSGGAYFYPVAASDINLPHGEQYGSESGFEISEELDVGEFKSIVVSYETFEDEKWENEYLEDFKRLYEGEKRK